MKTALLLIDMQQSLIDNQPWNAEGLLNNIKYLLSSARVAKLPVYFITDTRVQPDSSIHPSLEISSTDRLIEKNYCDSFIDTGLLQQLQKDGVDQLIIAGMQTEYCIDTTARSAISKGLSVVLVADAHSTFNTPPLPAEAIVAHHNYVLSGLTAGDSHIMVKPAHDINFSQFSYREQEAQTA